uniref:Uncharacterized protein n=1 Tax=Manihot esculenta TaxID=3983 RepID=A0A199U987_MANES
MSSCHECTLGQRYNMWTNKLSSPQIGKWLKKEMEFLSLEIVA